MLCKCGKPLLKTSYIPIVSEDDPKGIIEKVCKDCKIAYTELNDEDYVKYIKNTDWDIIGAIPKRLFKINKEMEKNGLCRS